MSTRSSLAFSFPSSRNHWEQVTDLNAWPLRPPPFPTSLAGSTYQDWMEAVLRQQTMDNSVWCLHVLRMLLEEFPWQQEALELYARLVRRTHHLETPRAFFRRMLWQGEAESLKLFKGETQVSRVDDSVERMVMEREHIRAYLQDTGKTDAVLIDMASGSGETTFQWAEIADVGRVFAFDICHFYALVAQGAYRHHKTLYAQAAAEKIPLDDGIADVVVLSAVLEHCRDPRALIAEAERLAVPGGLVLINVPYGGMEYPNPASEALFFNDHVRTFDLAGLLLTKQEPVLHYVSYYRNPSLPWAQYDEVGDIVGSYTTI